MKLTVFGVSYSSNATLRDVRSRTTESGQTEAHFEVDDIGRGRPACAQSYLSTDRSPARFRNAPHACAIGYTIDSRPALAPALCASTHMDDSIEPAVPVGAVDM
jgi:hypothetical protein